MNVVQSASKLKLSISTSISFEDVEEESIKFELSGYISFQSVLRIRQIRRRKLGSLNLSVENETIFIFIS
jgi:hypothetical protein